MPQQPPVAFRPDDDLEARLAERGGAPPFGSLAHRDLERYYALLREELRRLNLGESDLMLIADTCNGTLWQPETIRLLWAEVEDAIRLDGLDAKWCVDGAALVAQLRALTPGQTFALVDAIERAWLAGAASGDLRQALHDVGLLR